MPGPSTAKGRIKNMFSADDPSTSGGGGDEANWITSYADMITILLCFFMLFFNMSKMNASLFDQIKRDLKEEFVVSERSQSQKKEQKQKKKASGEGEGEGTSDMEMLGEKIGAISNYERIKNIHDDLVAYKYKLGTDIERKSIKSVKMDYNLNELAITIPSDESFKSGSIDINPAMKKIFAKLASVMFKNGGNFDIVIEGHSDSQPLRGSLKKRWKSNWELSAARAAGIVKVFLDKGISRDRLAAVGYGDSRPIVEERDSEGNYIKENMILNRRVVINLRELR